MLGETPLTGRSFLFLRWEVRKVLTILSQLSASLVKRYRGSDKCEAVFRSIDRLPACFCIGRCLCLEPILPVAAPVTALWHSTCKPYVIDCNLVVYINEDHHQSFNFSLPLSPAIHCAISMKNSVRQQRHPPSQRPPRDQLRSSLRPVRSHPWPLERWIGTCLPWRWKAVNRWPRRRRRSTHWSNSSRFLHEMQAATRKPCECDIVLLLPFVLKTRKSSVRASALLLLLLLF